MFSFFRKASTRIKNLTHSPIKYYFMATAAIGTSLTTKVAAAKKCFEVNDYDYLFYSFQYQNKIYDILKPRCNAYVDNIHDCAEYLSAIKDYGTGFFTGPVCWLRFHPEHLDNCTDAVLTEECTNGFGTPEDIVITSLISFVGFIITCGLTYRLMVNFNRSHAKVEEKTEEKEEKIVTEDEKKIPAIELTTKPLSKIGFHAKNKKKEKTALVTAATPFLERSAGYGSL